MEEFISPGGLKEQSRGSCLRLFICSLLSYVVLESARGENKDAGEEGGTEVSQVGSPPSPPPLAQESARIRQGSVLKMRGELRECFLNCACS